MLGQNLISGAMGQMERLPALAQELIEAKSMCCHQWLSDRGPRKASGNPTVAAADNRRRRFDRPRRKFCPPGREAPAEHSTKRARCPGRYPHPMRQAWLILPLRSRLQRGVVPPRVVIAIQVVGKRRREDVHSVEIQTAPSPRVHERALVPCLPRSPAGAPQQGGLHGSWRAYHAATKKERSVEKGREARTQAR